MQNLIHLVVKLTEASEARAFISEAKTLQHHPTNGDFS